MCDSTLSSTPLSRCGSVVIDFMMRFNQSVVVSNVLTLLSDAAREDQFGGFKVNPDSVKQVLMPTDGSEGTTKGKNYKEIVYTYSFENGLFLTALGIKKTHFCKGYTFGLFVFAAAFVQFKTKSCYNFFNGYSSTLLYPSA